MGFTKSGYGSRRRRWMCFNSISRFAFRTDRISSLGRFPRPGAFATPITDRLERDCTESLFFDVPAAWINGYCRSAKVSDNQFQWNRVLIKDSSV
ncbi:hypothetical protein GWI33_017091 [Rhynchophorus ferrugineus]|uniref:Uncharacterized protein n=1 Tax=Rhynchophorus ferrugineus TaxID=354439 RepID=A0A834I0E1_RHYFE|nr:hypothetical protein GWI33_017091 [Rhynchophorus ferrugineus]